MACEFIDAAIGMETSINDEDAKAFAGAFYNSLGHANPVGTAFEQAIADVTATTGTLSGKPRLYVKPGVRPDEMVIVAPAPRRAAQARSHVLARVCKGPRHRRPFAYLTSFRTCEAEPGGPLRA
jgi:hypothetical protein